MQKLKEEKLPSILIQRGESLSLLKLILGTSLKKAILNSLLPLGLIQRGFSSNFFHVITERELFGEEVFSTRKRKKTLDNFADLIVKNLSELKPGDSVVHIDHGVGRYEGLSILKIEDRDTEFLVINYAEDSKLYVPVSSLELISRYSGIEGLEAPLHRLGGETWKKEKKRAVEQINDVAAELLDLYSKRLPPKGSVIKNLRKIMKNLPELSLSRKHLIKKKQSKSDC